MSFYAIKTLRKSMLATTTFTMSNMIAQYPVSGLWDIDLFVTALLLELQTTLLWCSHQICRLSALCNGVEPVPWTFPQLDCFHSLPPFELLILLEFLNHLAQAVIVNDVNLSQSQKHKRLLKSKVLWNGWFQVEDDLSLVLKNIVVFCWCWKWTLFYFFVWCFKKLHW